MYIHSILLIGSLLLATDCLGQAYSEKETATTDPEMAESKAQARRGNRNQVIRATRQPCAECPGQPGPCWLTCEQKNPLDHQIKVFQNVCSGERYIVWPSDSHGMAQPRSTAHVRPGESIIVELIHVNPNAWDEVVFSDSSVISTTPEPDGFAFGNTPKPAVSESAEKGDKKAGDMDEHFLSLSSRPRRFEAKLDDAFAHMASVREQLAENKEALLKLESLLTDLQRFEKIISGNPCFSVDQLLALQQPMRQQVRLFVGDDVNLSDAASMSTALLSRIKSYTATQNNLEEELDELIGIDWQYDLQQLTRLIATEAEAKPKSAKSGKKAKPKSAKPAGKAADDEAADSTTLTDTTGQRALKLIQSISGLQTELAQLSQEVTEAGCLANRFTADQLPDFQKRIAALSQSFVKGQTISAKRYIMPGRTIHGMAESITLEARGIRSDPKDPKKNVTSSLLNLTLPVVGGFELAFSTGLAISTLVDNQYVIQIDSISKPASGTMAATKVVGSTIRENNSKAGALLTTNLHGLWSLRPGLSAGFTFGIGLDIINGQRARYMGGLCMKFGGAFDNLLLSVGAVAGPVKKLSASREAHKTYGERIDSDAIPTYDSSGVGGYFGVSYILFSKKIRRKA